MAAGKSLDDLVRDYRVAFTAWEELQQHMKIWDLDNPWASPKQRWTEHCRKKNELLDKGWNGRLGWHWDEDWDGQIIRNCYALEKKGFIVTRFYRKRKIMFKLPPKIILSRMEVVQLVCEAIGGTWDGIAFNRGILVWWGPVIHRKY